MSKVYRVIYRDEGFSPCLFLPTQEEVEQEIARVEKDSGGAIGRDEIEVAEFEVPFSCDLETLVLFINTIQPEV